MPDYTGGMASRSRTPRVTHRFILALSLPMLALAAAVAVAAVYSPATVTAASPTAGSQAAPPQAAHGAPAVQARSCIVIDRRSAKVLWSRDAGLRLAPASTTKIMTALLVLEHYRDLTRMVRAPASVARYQEVAIGLRPGDRISVRQALRATMTKSANDACVTLATAVGGSEARFVTLMNRRARQLGLTHTHFVNSRGSPVPGHYSCARDLARLGRYAMRDAEFRDLVGAKTRVITWPPSHRVTVTSHNRLLDYAWGDGIKTGATQESKIVLVGSGAPGELKVPLIVVTMREPTRDREERDAVALFRWAAGLYEQRQIVGAGDEVAAVDGDRRRAARRRRGRRPLRGRPQGGDGGPGPAVAGGAAPGAAGGRHGAGHGDVSLRRPHRGPRRPRRRDDRGPDQSVNLRSPGRTALLRSALLITALAVIALVVVATLAACGGEPPAGPSPAGTAPPQVQAWTGILVERDSGDVLWSKDPDRELPPASCTKIMTALLTLEHTSDLDALATVPDIPLPQKVGVDLVPGDRISVRQALTALLVKSANDAALTLASYVGGNEARFTKLMNLRARQLGLTHTHFMNCRGTPEDGHYSSARDLATLGRFAMRDATFRELVGTRTAVIRYPPDGAVPVANHNRLLDYPWGDGIKTGATDVSGKVLVGSGKPGSVALIVVTMHEPTRDQEVKDAVALFEWGTAEYVRRSAASPAPPASTSPSP